jgi:hypothetical protein
MIQQALIRHWVKVSVVFGNRFGRPINPGLDKSWLNEWFSYQVVARVKPWKGFEALPVNPNPGEALQIQVGL